MDQDLKAYTHQPLASHDSIRILYLQPGSGDSLIRCTLKEVLLGEAKGKYEAVSYVWGRSDITSTIICNGAALPVTTNLELGLRTFRLEDRSRYLWADAVCINQKDEGEKSQQVRKMDKIFREADHVLCWLGRDDNNVAEDCFRFIRHTRIAMEREFQPEWTMDNLISDTKLVGVSKTAREWDFVAQLFEISWFQRVWIVQEAALARACYLCWGIHQVHFYEALSIASWLAYSIHAPSLRKGARVGKLISDVFIDIMHTFDNRPTWRDMILFDKILEDLHPAKKQLYVDLLFCARSLRVTDQRDVIYSSLGSPLAHSVNGEVMVAPNYTEPWKQQQIRAAKALLRNPREGPHVLSMIVHDSMAELLDDGIPSWVPRWNTFDQKSTCPVPLISTYEYRQKPFRASLGSPLFNTTFPSPDTLSITGWKYDTIAWVSSKLEFVDLEEDLEEWKPYLREKNTLPIESVWLQLLEKTSIPPEELIGQFSLTLARGRPASDDHVDDLLLYCERLRTKAGTETTSPFPPKVSTSEVLSIAERSLPRSRDRRLAMTTQGRMALVPLIAEANDVCCIVQGMDVPMVFRKATNGTYKCLGETYCSGVMEGELLGPECTNEPEWTELHIR
ncbi:related to heterokaryon incompatibility protein (het-6OR allele) [Fusarium fujikuroi IMI 58289]|uniref:Related to heterokaryon incompatibility protein (Het-6OR allele) n=1 Tax=Gibberella fujikuroi (strain CBS 195.34 / IMI 58289 / NRRL A-6831) TaxID=1279085 RepID=S0EP81_GIBF5|nr:related to heterokaryon incompatibility protein (het-6OR allele) [Fusarium fujikuroi IMI 58289]CCT74743.1 related to heterokaryon incompatibility protein (het-6OR allele) [Fusarium fujikuroi IMI 58289]SCO04908.1 related to heterokaryon incompatibility protein (het-6OR allele) [Fusarium fujikuroi]